MTYDFSKIICRIYPISIYIKMQDYNERYSDGSFLYECKCDCGNIVKTTSRLKSGHVKSCGC